MKAIDIARAIGKWVLDFFSLDKMLEPPKPRPSAPKLVVKVEADFTKALRKEVTPVAPIPVRVARSGGYNEIAIFFQAENGVIHTLRGLDRHTLQLVGEEIQQFLETNDESN